MSFVHEITLVIVSYNSENLISKNMEVIKNFPTVIIDNSKSKILPSIINKFDNIKLVVPNKNLGYGKANNLGVSYCKTPYILILNPDVLIDNKSIEQLYNTFLDNIKTVGMIGPSLYDSKMKRRTNGSISYIKKVQGKKILNSHNNIPDGNMCCDFLVGCCLFMKRDFFTSLGGFDNKFFMYFEDNDLCDRIIKSGKIIMEIPSIKIIHLQNLSNQKNFFQNIKMALIHKISSYIYLKKNLSLKSFIFYICLNFFDYFQRFIFNFLILRFKKSFKNLLRIFSIFLFLSKLYKFIY